MPLHPLGHFRRKVAHARSCVICLKRVVDLNGIGQTQAIRFIDFRRRSWPACTIDQRHFGGANRAQVISNATHAARAVFVNLKPSIQQASCFPPRWETPHYHSSTGVQRAGFPRKERWQTLQVPGHNSSAAIDFTKSNGIAGAMNWNHSQGIERSNSAYGCSHFLGSVGQDDHSAFISLTTGGPWPKIKTAPIAGGRMNTGGGTRNRTRARFRRPNSNTSALRPRFR